LTTNQAIEVGKAAEPSRSHPLSLTRFFHTLSSTPHPSPHLILLHTSSSSTPHPFSYLILFHTLSSSTPHPFSHLIFFYILSSSIPYPFLYLILLHTSFFSTPYFSPHLIFYTSGCLVLRYERGYSLFKSNRYYVLLFSLQFLFLPPLPPAFPHYCSHH
jgi:hypothetical protein